MSNADREALGHLLGSSARKCLTSSLAPQPQYKAGRKAGKQEGWKTGKEERRKEGKEGGREEEGREALSVLPLPHYFGRNPVGRVAREAKCIRSHCPLQTHLKLALKPWHQFPEKTGMWFVKLQLSRLGGSPAAKRTEAVGEQGDTDAQSEAGEGFGARPSTLHFWLSFNT